MATVANPQPFDRRGGPDVVKTGVEKEPLFGGPFFQAIAKRKQQDRDAKVLITADHGQTGVGKTACAVYLAKLLDTSPGGFSAEEKATLSVPKFMELWGSLPKGSAAILDEAEQIDARRAMTNENVDASMKFQTHRVRQVIPLLTLPSPAEIDTRIERLADFWVNIEARGRARIYEKHIHRIKQKIYYKTLQEFSWPNMDGDRDYRALARLKDEFIADEDAADNYVRESEVKKRIKAAEKETRKEVRDDIIRRLKEDAGLSPQDFSAAFDLSTSHLYSLARGDT